MPVPCQSACTPWASVDDACPPCEKVDPDLLEEMLSVATDVLFELSGRRFAGNCFDVVRPYRCGCGFIPCRCGGAAVGSWGGGPSWVSRWRDGGPCPAVPQISLPGYPVRTVTAVRVDGALVDPDTYRVDDNRWLVRLTDDSGVNHGWPLYQRLDLTPESPQTFEVGYVYGVEPPPAGVRAAADLACQMALACSPGLGECKLPERVTSIIRQGVSMVVLDPFTFLDQGKTGVYSVDLFLKAYNPYGLRRPAAVLSPDFPPDRFRR